MIRKREKSFNWSWKGLLGKTVGGLVALELCGVAVGYYFYRKINHDMNYRYKLWMNPNFAFIVEGYYNLGETLNSECRIRETDQQIWRLQGKKLKSD